MSARGYMEIQNFVNGTGQSLKSELFGFDNELIYQMMLRPSGSLGHGVGAPNKSTELKLIKKKIKTELRLMVTLS